LQQRLIIPANLSMPLSRSLCIRWTAFPAGVYCCYGRS
jgi:hypothetical protein